MDHTRARELLSARFDGEPVPDEGVDEHVAACAECASFDAGLTRIRTLAAALPRERAPLSLTQPSERAPAAVARRLRVHRLAPALAAALVVAVVVVVIQPGIRVGPASFALPRSAAADALTAITALYVEREIVTVRADGTIDSRMHEKIWWRAPAFARVERSAPGGPLTVVIERPGERYERTGDDARRQIDVAPSIVSPPEPLSPIIALVGEDTGAGPVIAGRHTRRIEANVGAEHVIAFVDADRFLVLGGERSLVLGKVTVEGARVTQRKRTIAVEIDPAIDDSLFSIPRSPAPERLGFRAMPVERLAIAPRAVPEGFVLVAAGRDEEGEEEMAVYARGSLAIVVSGSLILPDDSTTPVTVDGRMGTLTTSLYERPAVSFTLADGTAVSVAASLPPDDLIALAARMFPAPE